MQMAGIPIGIHDPSASRCRAHQSFDGGTPRRDAHLGESSQLRFVAGVDVRRALTDPQRPMFGDGCREPFGSFGNPFAFLVGDLVSSGL